MLKVQYHYLSIFEFKSGDILKISFKTSKNYIFEKNLILPILNLQYRLFLPLPPQQIGLLLFQARFLAMPIYL